MQVNFITEEEFARTTNELKNEIAELKRLLLERKSPVNLKKKMLSTSEVCKVLGCSIKTVERRRVDGTLRSESLNGRHYHATEDVVKMMNGIDCSDN